MMGVGITPGPVPVVSHHVSHGPGAPVVSTWATMVPALGCAMKPVATDVTVRL
jgi:hypothetical protein